MHVADYFHLERVEKCPEPLFIDDSLTIASSCEFAIVNFSPPKLGTALLSIQKCLKSLTIFAEIQMVHCTRTNIGDLRHMQTLEYLDIQGSVFLGHRDHLAN